MATWNLHQSFYHSRIISFFKIEGHFVFWEIQVVFMSSFMLSLRWQVSVATLPSITVGVVALDLQSGPVNV